MIQLPTFKRKILFEKHSRRIEYEEIFTFLCEDLQIKEDINKYTNWIFLFKDKKCYFQYKPKNGRFKTCEYFFSLFYSKLEYYHFNNDYREINKFIETFPMKYFKLYNARYDCICRNDRLVEKHFENNK